MADTPDSRPVLDWATDYDIFDPDYVRDPAPSGTICATAISPSALASTAAQGPTWPAWRCRWRSACGSIGLRSSSWRTRTALPGPAARCAAPAPYRSASPLRTGAVDRLEFSAARMLEIRAAAGRNPTAPHRGDRHDRLLPGLRSSIRCNGIDVLQGKWPRGMAGRWLAPSRAGRPHRIPWWNRHEPRPGAAPAVNCGGMSRTGGARTHHRSQRTTSSRSLLPPFRPRRGSASSRRG